MELRLRRITYDVYEKACLVLGLDPDDARRAGEPVTIKAGLAERGPAFLDVVLEPGTRLPLDAAYEPALVEVAVRVFFVAASEHVTRAALRARHYQDRVGNFGDDGGGHDDGPSMEHLMALMSPSEYHALRHDLSLEDCVAYLLNRATFAKLHAD